jgi:tripartite-type tricarboxylate transporter receptor subunit TctC
MHRREFVLAAAGAAAGLAAPPARAQEYPSRPIKWICPYLSGTAPDNTMRILAEPLSEILGQPVVVENKPGAAGNLGAQIAARAAPDGYTWVYSASPMSASMRMYRKPGFDVMRDFVHVGRISTSDLIVVVPSGSPHRTLRDLLEFARRNPGKLAYASGGVGSPAHMGAELMLASAGVEALHVPYKGASESVNAIISGHVDFALTIFSVSAKHIDQGRMRALAVTGPGRNARLPAVPTLAEAGVAGVTLVSFGGISMPAGTPAPIVARVAGALKTALERPAVRAKLESQGGTVDLVVGADYSESLRAEIALTEKLMKAAKIEPQ